MNSSIYNIYNTLLIHILQAYLLHKIKASIDAINTMAKFHFSVGIHNYGQTGSARPKLHREKFTKFTEPHPFAPPRERERARERERENILISIA